MKTIVSSHNDHVVAVAKLHDNKERQEQQRFIGEGSRVCSTLINAGQQLVQLYVTRPMLEQAEQITDEQNITVVNNAIMNKISQATTPSGIVGVFELPKKTAPEQLGPGIVLASIADPGNMGTLIRTCAAMGKKTIVVVESVDPWNPKVVQASAGTIGQVTIFQWQWQELLQHKGTRMLCALITTGGKKAEELDLSKALLVVGSEAHGIPAPWLAKCEETLSLTMPGSVESLNAAVAGSIAMYMAWGK